MTARAVDTEAFIPTPGPDQEEAKKCRREFYIMSITFGMNHATVTTPILYASTLLTDVTGNASNAILYGSTLVCSLFFANLLYALLGPKKGLSISMFLYSVYVFMFALSTGQCLTHTPNGKCATATGWQELFAYVGALLGGAGAGLLWTSQGAFYGMVCEKIATAEARPAADVTSELAGTFGVIFLGFECVVRALSTLLISKDYLGFGNEVTFFIWAAFALAATLIFFNFAENLQPASPAARGSIFDKVLAAVRLWRDPKLWLLQATNITFGFAVGWLGAFISPNVLTPTLNSSFIGFAGALLSGLAALLAKLFGPAATKFGKGPVLLLGAASFLCLAILSKFAAGSYDEDQKKYTASSWGWAVLVFYAFMGIGRAVYESTNKAIFADFFPGEKSAGAFANVFVFGMAASSIAFVLGAINVTAPFYYLLIVFAALTVPCFILATVLKGPNGA